MSFAPSHKRCPCDGANENGFWFGDTVGEFSVAKKGRPWETEDSYKDHITSTCYFNNNESDIDDIKLIHHWEYDSEFNKWTGESCLCCETQLLEKNSFNCMDCGCYLCGNCFIHGRHFDWGNLLCFNCRKFGHNKNIEYWSKTSVYNAYDDWWKATWDY